MTSTLLIALVALLAAARLGGAIAERLGQPHVLGELLAGVALGALPLVGFEGLAFLRGDQTVEALAGLGVVLLLFEVGLSTRLADLLKVGISALLVATVGVVVRMILGFLSRGAGCFPTITGSPGSSWGPASRPPRWASPRACSRTSGGSRPLRGESSSGRR